MDIEYTIYKVTEYIKSICMLLEQFGFKVTTTEAISGWGSTTRSLFDGQVTELQAGLKNHNSWHAYRKDPQNDNHKVAW